MATLTPADQRRTLQGYVSRGEFGSAYVFIALQIRNQPGWDRRIGMWLLEAANINNSGLRLTNRLNGSLIKTFVWRMNSLASLEEKGVPVSASQNQVVSDQLANNFINSYLSAIESGRALTPESVRLLDVASAVNNLGISPASYSGGVLASYFGFDMYGFNNTPGLFQTPAQVSTWIRRAEVVLQGLLVDTGNLDVAAGSFGQGGIELLQAFGHLASNLKDVPAESRADVAQFLVRVRELMYADTGNLGLDGAIQGRIFDRYTGMDGSTTAAALLVRPASLSSGFSVNADLRQVHIPGTPANLFLREDGQFLESTFGRNVDVLFKLNSDGSIRTAVIDGINVPLIDKTIITDKGISVFRIFDEANRPIQTEIHAKNNPLPIDFSDAGGIIGQQLGRHIAEDNQIAEIVTSAALQTVGNNLGDALDGLIGGQSATRATSDAFGTFGPEFGTNLQAAGIGAISSYLTSELIGALGINGFAGELANAAGGAVITQIVSNVAANPTLNPFRGLDLAKIGNAVGSFIGTKLASEVISFGSVGGQLGSAIGSSLGTIGVTAAIVGTSAEAALLGLKLGAFAGPVAALVGAFVGFILGGVLGSLFGGTPRSGADVVWDPEEAKFGVANAYKKQGGSKDAAVNMAQAVADTFNSVIKLTGGKLVAPEAVQTGNYGMRKKDFVYRPTSTADKDAITKRYSGKTGPQQLIGYGIYQGLTDADFQLVGGDLYVKRALYNTFTLGGISAENFDSSVLLGNLTVAQRYETYLANSTSINALIAAEPESVFTAEWAIVFARAVELGLTRRHAADWYGGFGQLMQETGAGPAAVIFDFDYDVSSDRISRIINLRKYVLTDAIDVVGQTKITATTSDDIIRLSGTTLLAMLGTTNANLTLNGAAFNGQATVIDVAATIDAGDGDDLVYASDRGDNLLGGLGNDTLIGGKLDDWLIGGDGNDRLYAGAVADGSVAVATALVADGGSGNYLDGGAGDDVLYGSAGSDWLAGGDGVDLLYGGAGGDILNAGAGNEGAVATPAVQGGGGSDQYVFNRGDGQDVYYDDETGALPGATSDSIGTATRARTANTLAKNWAGGGEYLADGSTKSGEDAISFSPDITMKDILLQRSGTVTSPGMDLIIKVHTKNCANENCRVSLAA